MRLPVCLGVPCHGLSKSSLTSPPCQLHIERPQRRWVGLWQVGRWQVVRPFQAGGVPSLSVGVGHC